MIEQIEMGNEGRKAVNKLRKDLPSFQSMSLPQVGPGPQKDFWEIIGSINRRFVGSGAWATVEFLQVVARFLVSCNGYMNRRFELLPGLVARAFINFSVPLEISPSWLIEVGHRFQNRKPVASARGKSEDAYVDFQACFQIPEGDQQLGKSGTRR